MKISLKDIPWEGKDLHQTIERNEIELENDATYQCLSPLEVNAHVDKADQEIIIKLEVTGRFLFNCGRCLEPVEKECTERFEFYFDITPNMDFIEISDDIRQEMVIALSSIVNCREDCKGICKGCGQNLNTDKCQCSSSADEDAGPFKGKLNF